MTVKELIEALQKLDPDLYVFNRGYEGGFDDVEFISDPVDMALNVNEVWYYGKHERVHKRADKSNYAKYKIVKGITL